MLFVSGHSPHFNLTYRVYDFFTSTYEIRSDVEVFHTYLRDENALGFTEVNGEEQFVQVCNSLDQKEFVTPSLPRASPPTRSRTGPPSRRSTWRFGM